MGTGNQEAAKPAATEVLLVTSGDLRLSANQECWPAQRDMEEKLTAAFARKGYSLVRAHPYNEKEKHGFISSQRMGMDVFMNIHPQARLVFATAAWQYSHHVLPGLRSHQGPILTVANWSGQWPGLVGLLNLNGSLVKAGKPFSSIARRVAARRPNHSRPLPRPRARPRQAARRQRAVGRPARLRSQAPQGHHGHLR
jgi:hypothetical protein